MNKDNNELVNRLIKLLGEDDPSPVDINSVLLDAITALKATTSSEERHVIGLIEGGDICLHCQGTGQPNGVLGGPEHGLCSWCNGSGKSSSNNMPVALHSLMSDTDSDPKQWLSEFLTVLRENPNRYADEIEGLERVSAALTTAEARATEAADNLQAERAKITRLVEVLNRFSEFTNEAFTAIKEETTSDHLLVDTMPERKWLRDKIVSDPDLDVEVRPKPNEPAEWRYLLYGKGNWKHVYNADAATALYEENKVLPVKRQHIIEPLYTHPSKSSDDLVKQIEHARSVLLWTDADGIHITASEVVDRALKAAAAALSKDTK